MSRRDDERLADILSALAGRNAAKAADFGQRIGALQEQGFPPERITALASDRSEAAEVDFGDETLQVEKTTPDAFRNRPPRTSNVRPIVAPSQFPSRISPRGHSVRPTAPSRRVTSAFRRARAATTGCRGERSSSNP